MSSICKQWFLSMEMCPYFYFIKFSKTGEMPVLSCTCIENWVFGHPYFCIQLSKRAIFHNLTGEINDWICLPRVLSFFGQENLVSIPQTEPSIFLVLTLRKVILKQNFFFLRKGVMFYGFLNGEFFHAN